MAELQILNSKDQWKTFKVAGPRFLIGRRDTCHMVLMDGWISREHTVLIETRPGEFTVQDLQSENGTFVNGNRVTESPLRDQDRLRVGRTEMLFVNREGSAAPRTPSHEKPSSSSGEHLKETTNLMTIAESLEEGSEATMAAPFQDRGRADLRDRLRRFEKLLQVKEEEIARLAAENAVVKRALAQGGLIDTATGQPDFKRLATPSPTLLGHPAVVRQTWNPFARVVFPGIAGDVVAPDVSETRRDMAIGVVRVNVLGLGDRGLFLADAFHRVGYRHVLAVGSKEVERVETGLPPDCRATLEVSPEDTDGAAARSSLREAQLPLATIFKNELWPDADLHLVLLGLDEIPGGVVAGTFLDLLEDFEGLVGQQSGVGPRNKGVIAVIPPADRLADPQIGKRLAEGLKELRVLSDGGRIGSVMLVEQGRIDEIVGHVGATFPALADDLVAGSFDALNRLFYMDPLAGNILPDSGRKFLLENGVCAMGLGATLDSGEASLAKTVEYALTSGLLAGVQPASRARTAAILALIGKTVLNDDSCVLDRMQKVVEGAGGFLPQARISTGTFVDDGQGVRVIACLGELPFPERLGA